MNNIRDVDSMFQIMIKLIGIIIVLIGVIMIYDARTITKKFFGFGDQNEGSSGLKILGYIISTIGGFMIYFINVIGHH